MDKILVYASKNNYISKLLINIYKYIKNKSESLNFMKCNL